MTLIDTNDNASDTISMNDDNSTEVLSMNDMSDATPSVISLEN